MLISDKGEAFVAVHEGRAHKAYRDAVGVITIGVGFTMRSGVFAAWWRANKGHDLRLGDTITDAECDMLLTKLLNQEYCPTIDAKAKPAQQYQFDACGSVSYNCGPGSLDDAWAQTLAAGDVAKAAALLRVYKLTRGLLARRRADEAKLLETGDYGPIDRAVIGTAAAPSASQTPAEIADTAAKLKQLGFATVVAYQKSHPDLVADGIVGPATRASLDRDIAARRNAGTVLGTAVASAASAGAGVAGAGGARPVLIALAVGLVVLIAFGGFIALRYRGELKRAVTPAKET